MENPCGTNKCAHKVTTSFMIRMAKMAFLIFGFVFLSFQANQVKSEILDNGVYFNQTIAGK